MINHELTEAVWRAGHGCLRSLAHVVKMPDPCPSSKVFESGSQFGTRSKESQRVRWLDQVM